MTNLTLSLSTRRALNTSSLTEAATVNQRRLVAPTRSYLMTLATSNPDSQPQTVANLLSTWMHASVSSMQA